MDLPRPISTARTSYKKHTEIVKTFINANGGKTISSRDWEFSPHLVSEHLGGKGIPAKIKLSLEKSIENRKLVAEHYESMRQASEAKLSESDLRHLSFIDRLETIQKIWFPLLSDQTADTESSDEPGDALLNAFRTLAIATHHTASERTPSFKQDLSQYQVTDSMLSFPGHLIFNDELSWQFRPPAGMLKAQDVSTSFKNSFPGMFTFELNIKKLKVHVWHPYHLKPVTWYGSTSPNEAKTEIRRYLDQRWPVRLLVKDSRGFYSLTREEICAFAWITDTQYFEQYERGSGNSAITPYVRERRNLRNQRFEFIATVAAKFDKVREYMADDAERWTLDDTELFSSHTTWEFLNVSSPSARAFDVYKNGRYHAELRTVSQHPETRTIVREGSALERILCAMKQRGDDVRLHTGRGTYRELKKVASMSELFDRQWELLF